MAATLRRLLAVGAGLVALASCTFSMGGGNDFPDFTAPVVDAVDAVSDDVETSVSATLQQFRDAGGPQIAVAVIESTGNSSIEDYTIDLAREWGVGDKDKDDGVVVLIALQDRTMRIEVGSGVEGDLTDVTASRIVNEVMIPLLRVDDVDGAVRQGADAVMKVWRGEGLPTPTTTIPDSTTSATSDLVGALFFFAFLVLVIGLPIFMRMAGLGRGRTWGGGVFIPGGIIGGGLGGRGHGGGFGGGFGGFGGGGGGGFSGGGSSGSW